LLGLVVLNAACYEHAPYMNSLKRRGQVSGALMDLMNQIQAEVHAWIVLPNHYHFLVDLFVPVDPRPLLGKVHGRLSREWNREDDCQGRKVWYQSFERPIRSRHHYYTTLNYIHHNAVKDGYCKNWQDWETGSAREFLKVVGRKRALEIWRCFPIKGYGKSIEG